MKIKLLILMPILIGALMLQASEKKDKGVGSAKKTTKVTPRYRKVEKRDVAKKPVAKRAVAKTGAVVNVSSRPIEIKFNNQARSYVIPKRHKLNVKNFNKIKKLTVAKSGQGKGAAAKTVFTTCRAIQPYASYRSLVYSEKGGKPTLNCGK
jgi:hypothetical protein